VALGFYAAPRVRADAASDQRARVQPIDISRIDELPPLPPDAGPNAMVQPLGMAVPVYRVISDEMAARGTVANTGAATAIVYRNSHDTGYARLAKSTAGNFTGNLLHLGNGFPVDGGEIKGYDLLVYNDHNNPGGDASCTVSLWDGDPLGLIDTRISDPPQPIPGTTCTFTELGKATPPNAGCIIDSDGDTIPDTCDGFIDPVPCEVDSDCGWCSGPVAGDDVPECPGLYRLVCDFDPKVTIPSRNVWMIVEWTEGCRMGWRWAFYEGPEIAAVGEENFCADTCPNSPIPCVDMAIELVDGPSQWSSAGVGTCCEDPGIVCDHSDGTYECGHPTSCSDGVASDFDAWCFGAPTYHASFVASVYANTDTTVTLRPISSSGSHTIAGNEIIMPDDGQTIQLRVYLAGWNPDPDDNWRPALKVWQAMIDSSGFTSGLAGALTPHRPPCTTHADCPNHDEGARCWAGLCLPVWQDCPSGHQPNACLDLPACDYGSHPNWRCGSTGIENLEDPGEPAYGMSFRLLALPGARGTFEVGFLPDPNTFMKDERSAGIPLIGLIPAEITIEIGKCCDRSGGPGDEECLDRVTVGECDAVGGFFYPGEACDPDIDDSIECGPFCGDGMINQPFELCDGTDDEACPGLCTPECTCLPFCGDDEVNQSSEQCDGADDGACPGVCQADCLCGPFCGDNVVNQPSEECDGTDAGECTAGCRMDCTCVPEGIPAVSAWGMVVLVLLILAVARIYHRRRVGFCEHPNIF
jgi:hypothetical protein